MLGDYRGARPYLERALAITRAMLGERHSDTATSLNNLGMLLYDQGDLAGARLYYEQAPAICEHTLGPDHDYTRSVRNNLDGLLDAIGRSDAASDMRLPLDTQD